MDIVSTSRRLSIITVSFNSARTIEDTLRSVVTQSYDNLQYIIIDGGSTDGTQQIIDRYKDGIARFISEPDKGIYDAMNKGLKLATGDIVGILNSDDIYTTPDILAKVAKLFEDPTVDVVYGDLDYVKHDDIDFVTRRWRAGGHHHKSFHYGWMPPHPTVFVKRTLYEKVGLFDTSLRSAADYEMMVRMFVKHGCKAVYLPILMVKMRVGGISNSSVKNRLKANNEDRLAWKKNNLKPYPFTLLLKPLRKITQFIRKPNK